MKRFGRHFLKHRKGGCGCLGHHEASFDEIECFNGRESAEGGNFAVKSAGSKVGCEPKCVFETFFKKKAFGNGADEAARRKSDEGRLVEGESCLFGAFARKRGLRGFAGGDESRGKTVRDRCVF